jgi:hypothetical protein
MGIFSKAALTSALVLSAVLSLGTSQAFAQNTGANTPVNNAKKPEPPASQNSAPVIAPIESPADQQAKLEQVLKFVFENEALKHGWPANYTALWCPTNVFNLLRRLDEAKVDLTNARVLYVLPDYYAIHKGLSTIRPRAARVGRDGPINEWTFHVILEIDKKILDLDFTNTPQITPVDDYYAQMFGKGPKATQVSKQTLYLRSIPALDYLRSYTGNWEWYVSGAGGRYRAINLESEFAPAGTYTELPIAL